MTDGEMKVVVVLAIQNGVAMVQLPDTLTNEWGVASLPQEAEPGDRVGLTVEGGDFDLVLLPRPLGLRT